MQKSSFREAKKVAERAKVFEASSEEESLTGFENAFSSEMSAMVIICHFFGLDITSLILLHNGGYYKP